MDRDALLSTCGRYRYNLLRTWGTGPKAVFVMLNPSTADADVDDPTIRRCVGFAKTWGCGSLMVVNLFAYRATRPADMLAADDPVGPANNLWLGIAAGRVLATGGVLVAAWGARAPRARVEQVRAFLDPVGPQHLGLTVGGHPRHPLYLRADTRLTPWTER